MNISQFQFISVFLGFQSVAFSFFNAIRMVIRQLHKFTIGGFSVTEARVVAVPFQMTRAAPTPVFIHHCIVRGQFVTLWAMCFLGIYRSRANTPQGIYRVGNSFNVHRINTMSHSTQVVTLLSWFKNFIKQLKNDIMSQSRLVLVILDAIASVITIARPFPARFSVIEKFGRNFYFGKDASKNSACNGDSDKLTIGHLFFSLVEKYLVRLVGLMHSFQRAVSIIPQFA